MAGRLELLVISGDCASRRFAVGESGLRVGRASSNDVSFDDEALSRNHCLFDQSGETGIRVTDLASANGTFVNGVEIGEKTIELKDGDTIELGQVKLLAAFPAEAGVRSDVDLGLGRALAGGASIPMPPAQRQRSAFFKVLVAFAILLALAAGALFFFPWQVEVTVAKTGRSVAESDDRVLEFEYERVVADTNSVFRFALKLDSAGVLKVTVDDLPVEDRHVVKGVQLSAHARAEIDSILSDPALRTLGRDYFGPELDGQELKSRSLKIVYSSWVKTVSVVNVAEPEVFTRVADRLEAFSKNELGVWAIAQSRDKLIESAAASAAVADEKWADREVEFGNLSAAIKAWTEAMAFLETLSPKPREYETYRSRLAAANAELDSRYRDHRFDAERAINIGDLETAREELAILIKLVPARSDERNREALAQLVDVEKRLKKEASR